MFKMILKNLLFISFPLCIHKFIPYFKQKSCTLISADASARARLRI